MIRRVLTAVFRFVLKVFFQRIEVVGLEKVPPAPEPAIFVLNHPNGLIDPLFILCLAPRRVSFLAKSTIFKMPIIGAIARGLDSLPVYRHQDQGEDPRKNLETFAQARDLLTRGGTIAIFPEGTTHNEPSLKPLKSGAARIALSARAGLEKVTIVPAGLYYTQKHIFRSEALVLYGDPIDVPRVEPGDPPKPDVDALTERIDAALRAVTLNASHTEALDLIARAERIFSASVHEHERTLARELEVRKRLEEGLAYFRERDPATIDRLEERIHRYEHALSLAGGLDPATLKRRYPIAKTAAIALGRVLRIVLALPMALGGAILHYPAYRLAGWLAARYTRDDDVMLATAKALGGLLFIPATWAALATFVALRGGGWFGVLMVLIHAPVSGWLAIRFQELLDDSIAAARAFFWYVARPTFFARMFEERKAIRAEIERLAEVMEREKAPQQA